MLGRRGPDVLAALDGPADRLPGRGELAQQLPVLRPRRGAAEQAASLSIARPVGEPLRLPIANQPQVLRIELLPVR